MQNGMQNGPENGVGDPPSPASSPWVTLTVEAKVRRKDHLKPSGTGNMQSKKEKFLKGLLNTFKYMSIMQNSSQV